MPLVGIRDVLAPLRRRRPFLDSRDPEEALSRLGGVCDHFSIERRKPSPFFLRIRGVEVAGSAIVDIHSGPPMRLRAEGSRGQYRLLLPTRGGAEMIVGKREVGCSARCAGIVSPHRDHAVWSADGSERLWLTIDQAAVTRVASAMLGEGIDRPIEFEPSVDLMRKEVCELFKTVAFAAQQLGGEASLFSSPWLRAELEEMIATGLLLAQPHSHSDRLRRPRHRLSSREVMRAIGYIHDHLHTPITLADLAEAAGVPGRTLRQHFRRAYGLSPMAYLHKARFEKARALLLAEPGLSVTEAALRVGFDHLGRFAVGYRRRFGETPSQTAARRDRRC